MVLLLLRRPANQPAKIQLFFDIQKWLQEKMGPHKNRALILRVGYGPPLITINCSLITVGPFVERTIGAYLIHSRAYGDPEGIV